MYVDCFTFFDYVFSSTLSDIIVVNIGKKGHISWVCYAVQKIPLQKSHILCQLQLRRFLNKNEKYRVFQNVLSRTENYAVSVL